MTKIRDLRNAQQAQAIAIEETNSQAPQIAIASSLIMFKSLKLEKLKLYKSLSVSEHIIWFCEIDINMMRFLTYFTTNKNKILYCMLFLENDVVTQWYSRTSNDAKLKSEIFEEFRQFLLNLIANLANRRLLVYERWKNARQKLDQKVIAFKRYLNELKTHLLSLLEKHRIYMFLAKLKSNLKVKILGINNVLNIRDELLAIIIM